MMIFWGFYALAGPSWFLSSSGKQRWGFIPAYSRNATHGHTVRGRFFIYPVEDVGYYTGWGVAVSEKFSFLTSLFYEYWRENGDEWGGDISYNDFSDPYYGAEGSLPENLQYIAARKIKGKLHYLFELEPSFYTGVFALFSYRKELKKPYQFPVEYNVSSGLLLRYDSRSNKFNPLRGEFYELRSWVNLPRLKPLFVEGDLRFFFPLISPYIILALHLQAGWTFLEKPSYFSTFSLGGPKLLRGFWSRRFLGEKYHLSQIELRIIPLPLITLTGFIDMGQATDKKQLLRLPPLYSFGFGVLVGLPPKYDKKIRMEYSVGKDQKNFVVSFNHAF